MPVEQELVSDLAFDYQIMATYVSESLRREGKSRPSVAYLTSAITNVTLEDTIEGSSTLTLTLADPGNELLNFFAVEKKGRVQRLEINYPNNSQYWWRLTSMNINASATEPLTFELIFMERVAVYMQHHHGPKKAKRGKTTRAEFLRSLVKEIKADRINFVSHELHDTQKPIGRDPVNPDRNRSRKSKGLHTGMGLKIANGKANKTQLAHAETALDVAYYDRGSSELAVEAMVVAGIGESGFKDIMNLEGSGYGGVFQGAVNVPGSHNSFAGMAPFERTKEQAKSFLAGGRGYQQGGAEHLASLHKDWSPGKIATLVEASGKPADFYDKWLSEAQELIEVYGGGFPGGPITYRKRFFFRIGDEENPRVDYWTGSLELAEEVNWRYFCNGKTIYFDDDMTLITQKPVAVIERTDPSVVAYRATWDERRIATLMELELICDPFQFNAGEVFVLKDFGPLSTGSTARPKALPGRWLIVSSTRSSGDIVTTFELAQPERDKREPANELGERPIDDESTPGNVLSQLSPDMTPKDVIDEFVIPLAKKHDMTSPLTPKGVYQRNQDHKKCSRYDNGVCVVSDHWVYDGNEGGVKTYAIDMDNGGVLTPQMNALADELAAKFGFDVSTKHVYTFGKSVTKFPFRFQLGYGKGVPDHDDHVHFGCELLSGPPAP